MGSPSLHHLQSASQSLSQSRSQLSKNQTLLQLLSQDSSLRASRGRCEAQRWRGAATMLRVC